MNFRAAMKRIYANSNSEVSFPAFKATKHGAVTLVLPGRVFSTDLTIHMDVKANPEPGIDRVNRSQRYTMETSFDSITI